MLNLSDTLAVIGALGLGALLDVAIRPQIKARFSSWLAQLASRIGGVNYGGSAFLDRWFGPSVLSWRAVPRYVLISLTSIALSYGFAVMTSGPHVQPLITIFPGRVTGLGVVIVLVCLTAAVVGDIFSYAQTRLFVRAIDQSRSAIVSLALVAADVIVSLSIFFVTFSVARLICVLLVLQITPVQVLSKTDTYAPVQLAAALAEADVEVGSENESVTAFAIAIANGRTAPELQRVADWQRRGVAAQLEDPKSIRQVKFTAHRACAPGTREGRVDAGTALTASQELFEAVMAEQAQRKPVTADIGKISEAMSDDYYARAALARRANDGRCFMDVTAVRSSIDAADLVGAAGVHNAWWAAFERTLYDAYQVVGFKLAPYVGFDPYSSAPAYFGSLNLQLQNSFLGALPIDRDRASIVSYLNDPIIPPKGQVNVPFSPMVASALTTSGFLIAYLLTLALAAFRGRVMRVIRYLMPALDLDRAVFTSLSVALASIFLLFTALIWTLQTVWRLILGFL
ncbi:hypothetical protein [Brevundimonas sp.]|uniref:hypothetical protein n=1 Tax=Brevundimonas sp. TaxID=1871086 RepID=UPI002D779A85|nr:hypothetical protein [Brevundimonas sp.]